LHSIPIIGTFGKRIQYEQKHIILLGDHFEGFISKRIKSGRFHSASEVIRAGLRLLELEEKKMEELRSALEKGEQSGIARDFNSKSHLTSLHLKNE